MEIKKAFYLISSPNVTLCPAPDKKEFAFIGRSNVGKSSFINAFCNKEGLAKTSASPGKTQMINHFLINDDFFIVDLPGYGYAKVSQSKRKEWEKMIQTYLLERPNLINVFILIDSRHTPQSNDLDFVHNLGKWNVPFSIIFTKSDKEKQRIVAANVNAFMNKLKETWQFLPAHFLTSATKKTGLKKISNFISVLLEGELEDDFEEIDEEAELEITKALKKK